MTSNIEWTEETWNPTTGCDKVSPGCSNCYAKRMSKRLKAMGQQKYRNGFEFTQHYSELFKPLQWKKPRKIFVNSMSDLFHSRITVHFLTQVFQVMNHTPQHTYQILTKRSDNLIKWDAELQLNWTDNIWIGVSVESHDYVSRVENLIETRAKTKFLSCEPLLGPLDLTSYLDKLDWVIVGGESGPKHSRLRNMKFEWAREIQQQCETFGVPYFFKQAGTLQGCSDPDHKCGSKGCKYLDKKLVHEFPVIQEVK